MRLPRCIQVSFWPGAIILTVSLSGSKAEPPLAAGTAEAGRDSWTSCRATVSGGGKADNVDCRSSQFSRPFRLGDTASPLAHSHWRGWSNPGPDIDERSGWRGAKRSIKIEWAVNYSMWCDCRFTPSLILTPVWPCKLVSSAMGSLRCWHLCLSPSVWG